MTAYGSALTAVHGHLGELEAALALWATRDDTKPQPDVRQAANDAIDATLREMYGIRSQLVSEVRESDEASTARAEALLRRIREERGQ